MMYKKDEKNKNQEANLWVSYADLMAGLLFVFILVIASIVIKYLYTQHRLADSEDAKSKLFYELAKTKNMYEKSLEDLKDANQKIVLSNKEIEKLKALLLEYDINIKDEKSKNDSLSLALNDSSNQIALKDEELKFLADKLLVQTQIHQKMVEDFDIAKLKIKTLTGIKLNVIAKLKEKLGNSIHVDEKSGAIKFSSNILLDDKEISKYIENITIEGHTNSDGTYLANLLLSQQRALAVMQFLYESNIVDKKLLSTFVNSSGRSSADLILDKKGVEDKDASRRIEIKFNIKNEEAIKEIQNYLDKQNENRVQ